MDGPCAVRKPQLSLEQRTLRPKLIRQSSTHAIINSSRSACCPCMSRSSHRWEPLLDLILKSCGPHNEFSLTRVLPVFKHLHNCFTGKEILLTLICISHSPNSSVKCIKVLCHEQSRVKKLSAPALPCITVQLMSVLLSCRENAWGLPAIPPRCRAALG